MPTTKKRGKKAQSLKQQKLLKSRLMRISMVIDDYVYKHKALCTTDARAYIKEVSKYKLHCREDPRILQVIEKITRCMNSILAEQNEECDINNFVITTAASYCPSPVYSLPEEDRILTQVSDYPDTNISRMEKKAADSETIDLSDDDAVNRNIRVDVEIHRAMSNLYIRESNGSQNLDIIDCSQSILKDFNANRDKDIKNTAVAKTPQIRDQNCNQRNEQKTLIDTSQINIADFSSDKTNANNNALIANTLPDKQINNASEISSDISNIENMQMNEKINLKRVNFSDIIETIDLSAEPAKKPKNPNRKQTKDSVVKRGLKNKLNSGKQEKVVQRKKKSVADTKQKQASISISAPNTNKIISKNRSTKSIQNTISYKTHNDRNGAAHMKTQSDSISGLHKVDNAGSVYNKSMAKIYNACTENDLSWVENIRYVRQISTEEYDPKYGSLTEDFWENFALPDDWNEKEFDYVD